MPYALIFGGVTLALVGAWLIAIRQLALTQTQLSVLKPMALRGGAAAPFFDSDWTEADSGGDRHEGKISGLVDHPCPCQWEYTVASLETNFPARPNKQQIAAATQQSPLPEAPGSRCGEGCVQVMTDSWQGWVLMQNKKTGAFRIFSHTFAQYHCEKPTPPCDPPPDDNPT
jgi:hypothetical protein